jgi:hypothetical protein
VHFTQVPVSYIGLPVSILVETFSFPKRLLPESSLKHHGLTDIAAQSVGLVGISVPQSLIGDYRLCYVLLKSVVLLADPGILSVNVDAGLEVGGQEVGVPQFELLLFVDVAEFGLRIFSLFAKSQKRIAKRHAYLFIHLLFVLGP